MPGASLHRGRIAGLFAAWGLAIAGGMLMLSAYAASPGDAGSPPPRWPAGATVPLDAGRPTLLIFVHPRCPCSRASLAELAGLMDRHGDRVEARAVLYRPRGGGEAWDPDRLRAALDRIPGLDVRTDIDGVEARRFAVATSGHVVLYSPAGDRLFSGGITAGRGMQGENRGRATLLDRILKRIGQGPECPVFGCPLATTRPVDDQGRSR